jgi:hypothetical protein
MVRKKVESGDRLVDQMQFAFEAGDSLHGNYFDDEAGVREPFAMMHHVHG